MFGAINLEFAVCSLLCVPFVLNSRCSHAPWFPCVATFMKAICREHWEQTYHFSSSTVVLVPITGRGSVSHNWALPIFSLAFQIAKLTKKWAELTWAELTREEAELTQGWIDPCGPNWPGPNWNWPELTRSQHRLWILSSKYSRETNHSFVK